MRSKDEKLDRLNHWSIWNGKSTSYPHFNYKVYIYVMCEKCQVNLRLNKEKDSVCLIKNKLTSIHSNSTTVNTLLFLNDF